MTFREIARFAFGALSGHGLRSGLSMLGVSIGVAAVIMLTALGEGARSYVTGQFASLGTNIIIVVPGKTETTGAIPGLGGTPRDLTIDDARTIRRAIPEITVLAPVAMGTETVSAGQRSRQVPVVGSTHEMLVVRNLSVGAGAFLPDQEWDRGAPVAVIGTRVARELYPGANPLGQVIRVGDFRMRVIGVSQPKGTSLGLDIDDMVFIPVATAMRLFDRTSLFRILLRVNTHADTDQAIEKIKALLISRHDGEEDFTIVTQDAVASAFDSIFSALTYALAGIAAISLSVAGIGIMNVMLVSVSERTSEIGLLKAVGAHGGQVLGVFITEAALLSLGGGLLGLSLGWAATRVLLVFYPALSAKTPVWAVVAAMAVSLAVGVLFGVLPALRAMRMDPIAALRGR